MTTATIGIGDVMASQRHQEHFAHAAPGVVSEQSKDGALSERRGHEEWTQRLEEAWQGHLDTLQQCVCELLHKNQQLRMPLMAANDPEQIRENSLSR